MQYLKNIYLVKAYHQIPVAITTPFGIFEFARMLFGLWNAVQTFQRFINEVVSSLDFVFAYIDDKILKIKINIGDT